MNYGIWIIILAIINILTAFSGLPTGSKKLIIVLTTLILLGMGLMLNAIERRRRQKIEQRKQVVETMMKEEIEEVAKEIAHDVEGHVEEEIEHITHHEPHTHEHARPTHE